VPGLLQLPGRRAVQRPRRGLVAAVHHLPAPPPGPADRAHPATTPRPRPGPLRQSRRIPGQGSSPLPRCDPPRRPRRQPPATTSPPPPPAFPASLPCDARAQAAAAVALTVGPDDPPAWPALTLRFGTQVDTKPIARGDRLPGTGSKLSVRAIGNYIAKYATK